MIKFVQKSLMFFLFFLLLDLFVMPHVFLAGHPVQVEGKKVLVVASYHKGHKWADDIVHALEKELSGADLTVYYMDTKRDLDKAEESAREAYTLYEKLQPDAVISIDDNAQHYFVVPYLKNKVATPVIFCGVNDDAARYGFPADNVTGVLEKKHYRESISFAQIIKPAIRSAAVLYRPSPSNKVNVGQLEKEKKRYSADVIANVAVNSVADIKKAVTDYAAKVDAFILLNMTGVVDENNRKLEGHEAIALIADATDLVTIGTTDFEVEAGALCGVIKSGEEQGVLAASLLLDHWEGKAIKDLPLLQNMNGQRFINLKTLQKLGLKLKPEMVIGTKIITAR